MSNPDEAPMSDDDAKIAHLKAVWADGYNSGVVAAWTQCRERLFTVLLLGICAGVGVAALAVLIVRKWG